MAGYKLKTKSSAKKRFSFTGKGKIKHKKTKLRHILTKKKPGMKLKLRGSGLIADVDVRSIKRMMPYN